MSASVSRNAYAYCVKLLQVATSSGAWSGTDSSSDSYSLSAKGSASRTSSGSSCRENTSPLSESVFATVLTAIVLSEQPETRNVAATAASARPLGRRRRRFGITFDIYGDNPLSTGSLRRRNGGQPI